ncbi:sulfurtransferase [Brevibacillus sp. SYP-B805]|uniref:sulfurtransferase n=1 Tax=Brevibacillus sp. SYP-B805 TaxID=1578199 RepID=UPI0013ED190E|nr:sulfurtransferase [Brevibacillus sp. SYP-B805]NGQ94800.1 sulfurtransferase [Brevibacillus sp. SYP-B805]
MEKQNLVSVAWLAERLQEPDLVIADCRFTLGKPGQGLAAYTDAHIPGALYFDLEQDLSAPKSLHGGRHPLPDPEAMAALFSQAGIDASVTVVAYDDQDMAMAARLWWMLRYLGHDKVYVLDGGFPAWQKAGLPVTDEVTAPTARTFVAKPRPEMLADIDQVKERAPGTVLIDSRAGERYRGEMETIDPKAGHIPGAVNYFFKENLTAEGTMRPTGELKQRFSSLPAGEEIIVYCGSGVTACVNLLALHEIGRTDAKLYAGSWSDWCSYDLPVATGTKS